MVFGKVVGLSRMSWGAARRSKKVRGASRELRKHGRAIYKAGLGEAREIGKEYGYYKKEYRKAKKSKSYKKLSGYAHKYNILER